MPTYVFEAMNATGEEIQDEIEAATQDEAQATIRQMGYFITRIQEKKAPTAKTGRGKSAKTKSFSLGGVSGKQLTLFTRQLSILQDAGLPILRSIRILEQQSKPGPLRNALIDVGEEIESGSTLSEAFAKCPRTFNRLYVNMVRAGEAGGSLEIILRRLSEFLERSQSIKKKITGAMIYPCVVIMVAIGILAFIMTQIVPVFDEMFTEFDLDLPVPTLILINTSRSLGRLWFVPPLIPLTLIIFIVIVNQFRAGRTGWHGYLLKIPVVGKLIEKAILARTMRTLGTLVASGVPILEALTITRETSNNGVFEKIFTKVSEAIREGETIAKPLKANSRAGFHPVSLFFWFWTGATPPLTLLIVIPEYYLFIMLVGFAFGTIASLYYLLVMNRPVIDLLVVNMVDVGEETGELDTMLFKVSDYYDEEVATLTEGLLKLIEPLMIVFLGGAVGFIVISLFMPLVAMITGLSGGKK
ncbi:MAG TPA: type II secretion system F family protein [Pirellulaceae bacterium]|jgi:type IV pilus assembly protein PilC|nr:type II secretion system F family protein [Pirellulaceae bacterium]